MAGIVVGLCGLVGGVLTALFGLAIVVSELIEWVDAHSGSDD